MRFVHLADVHLGRKVDIDRSWGANASQEIYDTFSSLVDYVEVNPVDFIFITGDLFDHVPTKDELRWVDMELSRLKGVNIIYVTGEADYLAKDCALWKYKFISPVYLLNGCEFNNSVAEELKPQRTKYSDAVVDCVYFPKFNLDIYGMCQFHSFNERNDIEYCYARDLTRTSIFLAHGGASDVSPFDIGAMNNKKFAYVGLGHMHQKYINDTSKIYYPGSLSPLSPEETDAHGFLKGYIDEFICKCKFIPFSDRQYKSIDIKVDNSITNQKLVSDLLKQCSENKKYIYTINIERSPDCFTDFDLSPLKEKYRIYAINGDKSRYEDIKKLAEVNIDNALGKCIHTFEKRYDDPANELTGEYVTRMLAELITDYVGVIPIREFDKAEVEKAHSRVVTKIESELKKLEDGRGLCENETDKLERELIEYPDMLGELNTTREKCGQIEFEINQIEFKDKQVDKIYNRNKIAFVLFVSMPIALAWIYVSTLDFVITFFSRLWDIWFLKWINVLIFFGIAVVVSNFVYNHTKRLRKRVFKTPIPAEEHAHNYNLMNTLKDNKLALEIKIREYEEIQKKHNTLMKEIEKMEERRRKLEDKIYILQHIRKVVLEQQTTP